MMFALIWPARYSRSVDMKSFFKVVEKRAASTTAQLPPSYVRAIERWVWERKNMMARYPKYSPHAASHPIFRAFPSPYGWLGNMYAKMHPSLGNKKLKEDFDKVYSKVKSKSKKVKAERVEELRERFMGELSKRLNAEATDLAMRLPSVITTGKVMLLDSNFCALISLRRPH